MRSRLLSYGVLLVLLAIGGNYPGLSILPYLFMSAPLLFMKGQELGLRNYRKGILWGSLLLPLVIFFPPTDAGLLWISNQVAVAVIEEVFFRAYMMPVLGNVFTSLLFAGAHLINFPNLNSILTFFPSLLFGYAYIKSGSIIAPVLLHLCANLFYFSFQKKLPELYHLLK